MEHVVGECPFPLCVYLSGGCVLVKPNSWRHCLVGWKRRNAIVQSSQWIVESCNEDELAAKWTVGGIAARIFWLHLVGQRWIFYFDATLLCNPMTVTMAPARLVALRAFFAGGSLAFATAHFLLTLFPPFPPALRIGHFRH